MHGACLELVAKRLGEARMDSRPSEESPYCSEIFQEKGTCRFLFFESTRRNIAY